MTFLVISLYPIWGWHNLPSNDHCWTTISYRQKRCEPSVRGLFWACDTQVTDHILKWKKHPSKTLLQTWPQKETPKARCLNQLFSLLGCTHGRGEVFSHGLLEYGSRSVGSGDFFFAAKNTNGWTSFTLNHPNWTSHIETCNFSKQTCQDMLRQNPSVPVLTRFPAEANGFHQGDHLKNYRILDVETSIQNFRRKTPIYNWLILLHQTTWKKTAKPGEFSCLFQACNSATSCKALASHLVAEPIQFVRWPFEHFSTPPMLPMDKFFLSTKTCVEKRSSKRRKVIAGLRSFSFWKRYWASVASWTLDTTAKMLQKTSKNHLKKTGAFLVQTNNKKKKKTKPKVIKVNHWDPPFPTGIQVQPLPAWPVVWFDPCDAIFTKKHQTSGINQL